MLGVDEAFGNYPLTSFLFLTLFAKAPFTPFTRVPLLVLIGALKEGVMPIDGQVQIRKKITITATIDHR